MSDPRKPIYLTATDAELIERALAFWVARLNDGVCGSEAHKEARRYTFRRINEMRARLKALWGEQT